MSSDSDSDRLRNASSDSDNDADPEYQLHRCTGCQRRCIGKSMWFCEYCGAKFGQCCDMPLYVDDPDWPGSHILVCEPCLQERDLQRPIAVK